MSETAQKSLRHNSHNMIRPRSVYIFLKAQLSAFTGGITDYLVMILCTEFLYIHYTISIAIGGVIGAVVNFTINRYWSFRAWQQPMGTQLAKFCVMVCGSIFLKAVFTYLLTENLHLDYKVSRLCIELIVSLGFNFTMQKYWVFRR